MREIRIPAFLFVLLGFALLAIPVSWYDASLFFNPQTQGFVVIKPGTLEPTFMDIVWIYIKTNLWEVFLISCGCGIAWMTRERFLVIKI